MSDPLNDRRDQAAVLFGVALGITGMGIVAFIVGALYQCSAFRTSIEDLNQLLVFTPVIVTSVCCAAFLRPHGRRRAAIVLALFSVAGMAAMFLQSSWGETRLHGTPEIIRQYGNYTYASDMIFFFAHAIQLASAVLILMVDRSLRTTGG